MALTKALQKRIDLANKYIKFAQKHDIVGQGYFGSTWPSAFTYPHLITVSPTGRSVRVRYHDAYGKKEKHSQSFNTNDEYQVSDLRHEISNYIIKAIKNGAKDEGISIPKTLSNPTKRKNSGHFGSRIPRHHPSLTSEWSKANHAFISKWAKTFNRPIHGFIRTETGTKILASRNVMQRIVKDGRKPTVTLFREYWDFMYGFDDPTEGVYITAPISGIEQGIFKVMGHAYRANPRKRKNAGLNIVTVKFKNSKYNYETEVSPNTTAKSAYEYFVGQSFDMGSYPRENIQRVIGIDFNGKPVAANPRKRSNPEDAKLTREAMKVSAHWRVDRHEGEDDIVYELELFDIKGEGDVVQWFQQYEGMPAGTAEKELMSFLQHSRKAPNPKRRKRKNPDALMCQYQWYTIKRGVDGYDETAWSVSPKYSIPGTRFASSQLGYDFPSQAEAKRQGKLYEKEIDRLPRRPNPDHKREVNPYSKRYTLSSFTEKFWGKNWRTVPRDIRRSFWDDFKYAHVGGLQNYKEATRG